MSKKTLFVIYNFVGFQAVWAACAYGAINGLPLLGVYAAIIYIAIHYFFSDSKALDMIIMFPIAMIGIALDSLNFHLGFVSFNNESSMLPLWLVTLWFSFSLLLPHSLNWLNKYPLLAVLFGGIGGSGTYYIGHHLGAINLSASLVEALIAYFIEWAIIVPVAFWFINVIRTKLLTKSDTRPT